MAADVKEKERKGKKRKGNEKGGKAHGGARARWDRLRGAPLASLS